MSTTALRTPPDRSRSNDSRSRTSRPTRGRSLRSLTTGDAPSPRRRASSTALAAVVASVVVIVLTGSTSLPVGAAADVGGGLIGGPSRHAVVAVPPGGGARGGSHYSVPVDASVVDPFRVPTGPYGPGNRGLEYLTAPGSVVRSIGAGTVAFAGQVAGRLVISIDHPDGLRSSLVGLAVIDTAAGRRVARGAVVGRAGPTLHLGVRRAGVYLDPATLFSDPGPARLVPWPSSSTRATGFRPGSGAH